MVPQTLWIYFWQFSIVLILNEGRAQGQFCKPSEFQCGPFECIRKSYKCDGQKDCRNNKDEIHCEDSIYVPGRDCVVPPRPESCEDRQGYCDRYRTIDGSCNNLEVDSTWGMEVSEVPRLIPPAYADERNVPRGGGWGGWPLTLPGPRSLSQQNHPDVEVPDNTSTILKVIMGQFYDHDLTEIVPEDTGEDCCLGDKEENNCFPIKIPSKDPFYTRINRTGHFRECLNFVRSTPVCSGVRHTFSGKRQHRNQLTSFIDGGNVYGSNEEKFRALRKFKDGLLKWNRDTGALPTRRDLQFSKRPEEHTPINAQNENDFVAGDNRVNEQPFLTTMHTIWLREHNRIARQLKQRLPPKLDNDEVIFQETRRLVEAQMQNIAYSEFLPTLLTDSTMREFNLHLGNFETTYDPKVNPGVVNSFATAAFRYGHSMIPSIFKLVNKFKKLSFWRLRDSFRGQVNQPTGPSGDTPASLPITDILRGLLVEPAESSDEFISSELTNHLFQRNEMLENFGMDLMALNIQRGRDHGLPPYKDFRKFCKLGPISFRKTPPEHKASFWNKLKLTYAKVEDIDLWSGGIGEKPVPGVDLGPTFACIIAHQFQRLKDGDRHFFTHSLGEGARGMSPEAKEQVRKRSLRDVLCDNSDIEGAQMNVFINRKPTNRYTSCSRRTNFDFDIIAKEIERDIEPIYTNTCEKVGETEHEDEGCRRDECFIRKCRNGVCTCCNCVTCCPRC